MLAKIIDWSGRNRFLVLLATLFSFATDGVDNKAGDLT